MPGERALPILLAPLPVLIDLDVGAEARCRVMEVCRRRIEHVRLGAAMQHVDERTLACRLARQDRPAIEMVEVLGDRGAFGDVNTVLELEHRDRAGWIPRKEFGALVLAGRYVDGDELDRVGEPFLGERDADTGWIGKALIIMDLHHLGSLLSAEWASFRLVGRSGCKKNG